MADQHELVWNVSSSRYEAVQDECQIKVGCSADAGRQFEKLIWQPQASAVVATLSTMAVLMST